MKISRPRNSSCPRSPRAEAKPGNSITFAAASETPNKGLPAKSFSEQLRHRWEFARLQDSIKRKHLEKVKQVETAAKARNARESRRAFLTEIWKSELIPNWPQVKLTKRVRDLWYEGIPPAVWNLVIGNPLNITREMYQDWCRLARQHKGFRRLSSLSDLPDSHGQDGSDDSVVFTEPSSSPDSSPRSSQSAREPPMTFDAMLGKSLKVINQDVTRTFPTLGLFKKESGPYYDHLRDILGAFVAFQPMMGYVQGMSFLAATLLLVIGDPYEAFIAFVHMLYRPCHHSLFSLNEPEFMVYFHLFDCLVLLKMPKLHEHMVRCEVEPYIYLYDWLLTIFSRALTLETRLLVWDLFFLNGEIALFEAALAILHYNEAALLAGDFEAMATLLTGSLSDQISTEVLIKEIRAVNLHKSVFRSLEGQVRRKLTERASTAAVRGPLSVQQRPPVSFDCLSDCVPEQSRGRQATKKIHMAVHPQKLSVSLDRSVVQAAQSVFGLFSDLEAHEQWSSGVDPKLMHSTRRLGLASPSPPPPQQTHAEWQADGDLSQPLPK